MTKLRFFILTIAILSVYAIRPSFAFSQNILSNPGFEAPANSTTATDWTGGSGSNTTEVFERRTGGPFTPRSGSAYYYLSASNSLFSFVFQQATPVPGDVFTFNGFWNVSQTGTYHATAKIEFKDSSNAVISAPSVTQTDTGGSYTSFSVAATAPANAVIVSFVIVAESGGGADTISMAIDDVAAYRNSSLTLLANKREVKKTESATFTATLTNDTAFDMTSTTLTLQVPPGFNIVKDSVSVGGTTPTVTGLPGPTVVISVGTVSAASHKTVTFVVAPTSGAHIGKNYQFTATSSGTLSAQTQTTTASATLFVTADPLFDLGTVLGKVFNDENENGVQDPGERGIPFVRIITEQGIMVMSDRDGKYHIPGISPGRHLIKVDQHTLPEGTKFVTEQAYLTNVTNGILAKVSFAVKLPPGAQVAPEFQKDLDVRVIEEFSEPKPQLFIQLTPTTLALMANGQFKIQPSFILRANYGNVVSGWRIEIRNESGEEVWIGHGHGAPPSTIDWHGLTDFSERLEANHVYSYRLFVLDEKNREDATDTQYFKVIAINEQNNLGATDLPFPKKDAKREIILTDRSMVNVAGTTKPGSKVFVNQREVPVTDEGQFETQMMLPYGTNQVYVSSLDKQGRSTTNVKEITVKENTFTAAVLSEGEIGLNHRSGNPSTDGGEQEDHGRFWQQGRIAYFMKAKFLGRYRITSAWDTGRDQSNKLYTNFDPNDLYATYGDDSEIDYSAIDTQQRFYILAEMDRSYFKLGTYNTDFQDTKLATYDRTLSGLKLHLASPKSVSNGDPYAAATVFKAYIHQSADHNEIRGTGGSLYYLRNRRVIQGSEKLRIEKRDKITGVVLATEALYQGVDYEINYDNGRILLNKPLSSVAGDDSIIQVDPLEGNPVYLIVDYEYETPLSIQPTKWSNSAEGIRGYTYVGQHLKVGGTYVKETRDAEDHRISGIDGTFTYGKTRLYAEIAKSYRQQVNNAISDDGGLTYINEVTETGSEDGQIAYRIEGSTKIKKLQLDGYFQREAPGFSAAESLSQRGYRKFNITAIYPFTQNFKIKFRRDYTDVINQSPTQSVTGASRQTIDTAQAEYQKGKWQVTTEYRHQDQRIEDGAFLLSNFDSALQATTSTALPSYVPNIDTITDFKHAVAGKVAYQLSEKYKPYIVGQATLDDRKPGNTVRVGLEAKLDKTTTLTVETSAGNIGDGTLIGLQKQITPETSVYGKWQELDTSEFGKVANTTLGSSYALRNGGRIFTEREYDSYRLGSQVGDLIGIERPLNSKVSVGANFERSHVDSHVLGTTIERNVVGGEVDFKNIGRLRKSAHRFEIRFDDSDQNVTQWLTTQSAEFKLNEDYTLAGYLRMSRTDNTTLDTLFTNFTDANIGIAYRPVHHDKFNALLKYGWFDSESTPGQYGDAVQVREISQIYSIEGAYDLNKYVQIVEKLAYKHGNSRTVGNSVETRLQTLLWINRLNFHVTRKWDIAGEYRIQDEFGDVANLKSGILVEVSREIKDLVRIGAGYNFTDFDDDLRTSDNYQANGFFLRLTGKY